MGVCQMMAVQELDESKGPTQQKKQNNIWWRNGGETGGETDAQKFAPQEIFGEGIGTEKRVEKRLQKWTEKRWWSTEKLIF